MPVPVEIKGKITWQQDWVNQQPLKKESETYWANCVTVEEADETMDSACQLVVEEINGIVCVFICTEEADVEEKRGRSLNDEEIRRKRGRKLGIFLQ